MIACCWCIEYDPFPFIKWTFGERNVSGGVAWYQTNSKYRCKLKQEDKYPTLCHFTADIEKVEAAYLWNETDRQDRSFISSGL